MTWLALLLILQTWDLRACRNTLERTFPESKKPSEPKPRAAAPGPGNARFNKLQNMSYCFPRRKVFPVIVCRG